jgi:L-arabinonolactonase
MDVSTAASLRVDSRDMLGECALWCDRSQALWWTDIEGSRLHRFDPATGHVEHRKMPDRVGCFAFCDDPDLLLLGLAGGVAIHRISTSETDPVIAVESENPTTRINDGRCDREGRLVFGMFEQSDPERPIGHWYRVHHDLRVERLPLPPARVANSIAFSPDGRRMYHTDSLGGIVWVRDYHADGRIGPAEVMVRFGEGDGLPDGACVDEAGGLWIACWRGAAIRRFDADGQCTEVVDLPVSNVTSQAFGGSALDTIFITTARAGLDAQRAAAQPQAGGLFSVGSRHRGLPEARFHHSRGA